jgi:hypothetical protein
MPGITNSIAGNKGKEGQKIVDSKDRINQALPIAVLVA